MLGYALGMYIFIFLSCQFFLDKFTPEKAKEKMNGKKYKNDSTKNNGSIVIYFLFFKLLFFIFSLTVLNIKKPMKKYIV